MSYNPLFGLHLRMLGTWRSQLVVLLVLFGVVIALASVSYRMSEPREHGSVSSFWLAIIAIAQAGFLLLIAPAAIRRAVQRDFDSGMMESHRLSPMSGLKIVLGYLSGPPAQALMLAGGAALIGTYFAAQIGAAFGAPVGPAAGGAPPGPNVSTMRLAMTFVTGWYFTIFVTLMLALLITSLTLLVSLASAGKMNIIGIVVVLSVVGGWMAPALIPGLALLLGILTGTELVALLFQPRAAGPSGTGAVIFATAASQVAMAGTFILAAARKVRSPERPMFTLPLALLLLAIWGAALIVGMRMMPGTHPMLRAFGSAEESLATGQVVASTVSFMLIALFALTAAAGEAVRIDRARQFQPLRRGRTAWTPAFVPPLLALATLAIGLLVYQSSTAAGAQSSDVPAFDSPMRLVVMLAAVLSSYVIDYNILFMALARGARVFRVIVVWGLVLKVLPLALDFALAMGREMAELGQFTFGDSVFTGISPFGTLVLASVRGGNPYPGAIVQVGLAAVVAYIAMRDRTSALRPEARAPQATA